MTTRTYRLPVARLLIATFGEEFNQHQYQPLQVLAQNLDPRPKGKKVGKIQECLNRCRDEFRAETDIEDPELAAQKTMSDANAFVEKELAEVLGEDVELITSKKAYQIIVDNGEIVGHDTTGLLLYDDAPLRLEPDGTGGVPAVGGLAIIFLATEMI